MAVGLQPSQLLAAHLQVERQDRLTVFKFTEAAQARLEDLLTRQKDGGLTAEEQAELDALAELDRIFTYINRRFPRSEILQQSGMRPRSFCPENRMPCDCKVDRFILPRGRLSKGL